jgi:hypothetical protein
MDPGKKTGAIRSWSAIRSVVLLGAVSLFANMTTAYGLSWFLGTALMGIFYDYGIEYLVAFSEDSH